MSSMLLRCGKAGGSALRGTHRSFPSSFGVVALLATPQAAIGWQVKPTDAGREAGREGRCGADGPGVARRVGYRTRRGVAGARQLGYGVESVRSWVRQADIDDGDGPGVSTPESQRVKQLE